MTRAFERYHAIVLRSLIVEVSEGVHIGVKDAHGTINCFQVNEKIGLLIKHSAKRLSPYTFGFTEDNLLELELLFEASEESFIALVCGWDGFLIISKDELYSLASKRNAENTLSIHVSRRKRGMYSVGGRNKLQSSKPRGFSPEFFQALQK